MVPCNVVGAPCFPRFSTAPSYCKDSAIVSPHENCGKIGTVGLRSVFAVRILCVVTIAAGWSIGWALPFVGGELKSDRCPVRVPRLGPPISKPFVKSAKNRRRFLRLGPERNRRRNS